jgi:hypothetical protein
MQFLIHGTVPAEVPAALVSKQHAVHAAGELAGEADGAGPPAALAADPALLLPLLEKKQWHLLTTDANFVRDLYEKKVAFRGIIVLVLAESGGKEADSQAVERLFERYKRLTPGRLYTVTPNRVKIRQLPGAGAHRGVREN